MMDWNNRMKFRRGTAAAATVIGAMTVAMSTAHADPAAAQPVIDYGITMAGKDVVTKLKGGTFQLVDKQGATPEEQQRVVDIKDQAGNVALEMPLDFQIAGVKIPVTSVLSDNDTVLKLTPEKPAGLEIGKEPVVAQPVAAAAGTQVGQPQPIAAATDPQTGQPQPIVVAKPVASPTENQAAMSDFATKFGVATAVGGFVGTAIGAVAGCLITLPAGCVAGLITGAGVGGIIGTIIAGGPTLLAAGVELITALQAAPGTTQWANNGQSAAAKPAPAAANPQN
jgi:hypothetical protein